MLKFVSIVGAGGINDWNLSTSALYGGQAGLPYELGFPVFANCVQ